MVNINELRIGNWVDTTTAGLEFGIQVTGIYEGRICFGDGDMFDPKYVEPVSITDEILNNCGFLCRTLGDSFCYTLPYVRPMTTNKEPKHDIVLVSYAYADEKHPGKFAVAIREYDRDIQFAISLVESVHQLQNICFAITGAELEILMP